MITMLEEVQRAIEGLEKLFQPDELAYLALTQKVEHVVRDKVAYSLHRNLENDPSLLVCREWKRCDLAILQNSDGKPTPRLLIEAKAMGSADIVKEGKRYPFAELIKEDLQKSRDEINSHDLTDICCESLAMVIVTRPHSRPAPLYQPALKYYGLMSKWIDELHDLSFIGEKLDEFMKSMSRVSSHEVPAGNAFGIDVSVYIYLYKLNPPA